jgi:hypothetical protein
MATHTNSRPAKKPAVIRHAPGVTTASGKGEFLRLLPAAVISAVVHIGLFGLLFLVASPSSQANNQTESVDNSVKADDDTQKDDKQFSLEVTDDDPEGKDAEVDINYNVPREGKESVPGKMRPNDPAGVEGGKDEPLKSLGAIKGTGGGTGGGNTGPNGTALKKGERGGYVGGSSRLAPGSFYGRSGQTKKKMVREGGGNPLSEAAVARGLKWIVRHQSPDGRWSLDAFHRHHRGCNCDGKANSENDTAGTAFGLLPLLGAGYTHKRKKGTPNPYAGNVLRGLSFLMRKQNKRTGSFGGGMYAHGLATIAICEAYGLTRDPLLKRAAQRAVNYIVYAQDKEGGGWRYSPNEPGDTSVVGWQVMALKSAQMAELDVPREVMKRAQYFLDSVMDEGTGGYKYQPKDAAADAMTAVGLLCRQYLQSWGPSSPRMVKGVKNWLDKYPPDLNHKNMYYYYYATQVLHHFGGVSWKKWNNKMRDMLIATQDKGMTPRRQHQKGSWSPAGEQWGAPGGRLMFTSLSILTLEVYYRYLPLYRRDVVAKDDQDLKGMKK